MMNERDLYTSLLKKLTEGTTSLPDKPEETPERTLHALWHYATGHNINDETAQSLLFQSMDPNAQQKLLELVELRIAGEPLSYLIGKQRFMELEVLAHPGAMIPRQETEIVGWAAVRTAQELAREREAVRVIDLCTGSGNLALAVAYYEPKAQVVGIDITQDAVHLARQNAHYLHMEDRVTFHCGDLFAPVDTPEYRNQIDLVICNPPYISSAQVDRMPEEIHRFEPREAFDGGPFGIRILQRFLQETPRFLKPKSYLCFEVGAGQGAAIERLLRKNEAYDTIDIYADHHGQTRAFRACTKH